MTRHRFFYNSLIVATAFLGLLSCTPKEDPTPNPTPTPEPGPEPVAVTKPSKEIQQADQFAIDMLSSYYLWSAEVKKNLARLDPDTCMTPIPVVKEVRYHKGDSEIDHWTQLTKDLGSMTSSVQGLGLSYGYGLQPYWADNTQTTIVMVVQYVNKGKPADKAGLKRGDVIWTLDGKDITLSNYYDAYDSKSVTLGVGLNPNSLKSVSMTANTDWEDPVIVSKTFDIDGKKVGYLFYSAFDLESAGTLPGVFRQFKADGISELIIDLRYNGGGYGFTECELASMIAPPANVAAGDVFQTEVYNAMLTEAWKDDDFNTYFHTKYEAKSGETVIKEDVSDANPGISKLYAIVTGGSASASEGLIVGLGPYMNITLIGERTYGKYCAGYMLSPEDLYGKNSSYDYTEITKWGMYVMVSMFADKNGKNAAQPNGIPVNLKASDDVLDGYQLGDENESMLKVALKAAGKTYTGTKASYDANRLNLDSVPDRLVRPSKPKGFLIKTNIPALNQNL